MSRPLPDLAGTIIAARRTYEAAVSVRGAVVSGGDQAALRLEVHDQFKNLATTLGYLVTRDETSSVDGAASAASTPVN